MLTVSSDGKDVEWGNAVMVSAHNTRKVRFNSFNTISAKFLLVLQIHSTVELKVMPTGT